MRNLETLRHHPLTIELVDILCRKTQTSNELFFHVLVNYYIAKVAATMRTKINTHDRGIIPVNIFAINLAISGAGKGHSTNIMEESVINQFKSGFLEFTLPSVAEENLQKIAIKRAARTGTDSAEEYEEVCKEFKATGAYTFSFDSGTPAAVKQMRHKLLMADAGAMNLEIDEIGSNLLNNVDVLNTFLELYDVGKIKPKLTKNTADNTRNEDIDGKTPTNLMLFGTPSKLFDGGKVEAEFTSFQETGYARRCFYGFADQKVSMVKKTAEEVYEELIDRSAEIRLKKISDDFGMLADRVNFDREIQMTRDVSILLIEYKMHCEALAETLGAHEDMRKAELSHRYFKVLKLAGCYAFVDGTFEITEDQLYYAIKMAEDSGKAFAKILTRERNYVRLAKYIAQIQHEVTHVDLVEDLPFFKGTAGSKTEMMTLAIAWGYKNNIIIQKSYVSGIEFLSGKSLKETDLDQMTVAYSEDWVEGYINNSVPFDQLHTLTSAAGLHWLNHHAIDGYRDEKSMLPGFNMVVIDVDDGCSLETAKLLLKDYKALYYTTKRHTEEANRFRIILPMNYNLSMDADEFKQFMNNVYDWLPFKVDSGTNQRSRKWMSHAGDYEYVDGQLLDAMDFIPQTSKNDEREQVLHNQQSLTNLQRWFVNNTGIGNRSDQLHKYAMILIDQGMDYDVVHTKVLSLNEQIQDPLTEIEVSNTIMNTSGKKIKRRNDGSK